MSATEQMRAMLDQLMGTDRADDAKKSQYNFYDPQICKCFLLDCCPHEILASTRLVLGECSKVHELALRADYKKAAKTKQYNYELDALEILTGFIAESDRRTEMAKKRLAETQEVLSAEASEKLNRVHELVEMFGKKLAAAEAAGNEGNVEESLKLMEEVEKVKKEKSAAENDYRNSMPASSYQQQKLRVCEVCSAYLGIQDNDRRLADHFGGKLHLGFIAIREKFDELKELVDEKRKSGAYDKPIGNDLRDRDRDRGDRGRDNRDSRRGHGGGGGGGDYDRERSSHRSRRSRSRSGDRDSSSRDSRRYRDRDNYSSSSSSHSRHRSSRRDDRDGYYRN